MENMVLIHPAAEQYAQQFSTPDDALLQEIADWTATHHTAPHMLSGPVQGRLLQFLSRMLRPRRILEIGTFTGYSALCLAAGLQDEGMLHTIELREADALTARSFFNKSKLGERIIIHQGNALEIIPTLEETWDLVFIDADKTAYSKYYELTLPGLRNNGLLIADNVLFHGQVLEDPVKGKNALAIEAFNRMVRADESVQQVLLTVRDGLLLVQKKDSSEKN